MKLLLYIAIMALVTYAIRAIPFVAFRKRIRSRFVQDFLYYVPYVTLAVMTFPAIIQATEFSIAGALALIAAILLAYFGKSLLFVAVSSCAVVFITELIIKFFI